MKHLYALLIKFFMIAVILEIILNMLTDLTFAQILYISVAVTLIAYVIGDLLILSMSNNTVATLADTGLALITIYAFNLMPGYPFISFVDALISTILIGLGEWLFHKYVAKNVFPKARKT